MIKILYLAMVVILIILIIKYRKTPQKQNTNDSISEFIKKNKNIEFKIGLFISIIGIAGIVISQTANFSLTYNGHENETLKNIFLYGGIVLLVIGAALAIFTFEPHNKNDSNNN
jgi:magnesium-transporting ATPase (P-type)